jgi:hypothetical protein
MKHIAECSDPVEIDCLNDLIELTKRGGKLTPDQAQQAALLFQAIADCVAIPDLDAQEDDEF